MYEAFYVANLFFAMNETNWHTFDDEYYALPSQWFERWKKYVNFDYYMGNTEKFLKLNNIEESSKLSDNFMEKLDTSIQIEINKYFDSYFLATNSESYPGVVTTQELLYDKSLHFTDFDKPKSVLNYNIQEQYENGRDFFMVTKPIWKYFKNVYGGKEIKRYSSAISNNGDYVIETKLKNISLCILKIKKRDDNTEFIDRPKFLFFPRKGTLNELKRHLIKIFSVLRDVTTKEIRLWILDPTVSFETFEEYTIKSFREHNYEPNNIIGFPGFCLEVVDGNTYIGDLDEVLVNKIVVVEYIDEFRYKNFVFKKQNADLKKSINFNEFFDNSIDYNKFWQRSLNILDRNFNDPITEGTDIPKVEMAVKNANSFFQIKDFFLIKNGLRSDSDKRFLKSKDYLSVLFEKEIKDLKEHLYLVMDKNELLQKFSISYTQPEPHVGRSLQSLQEIILKKREKTKFLSRNKTELLNKPLLPKEDNDNFKPPIVEQIVQPTSVENKQDTSTEDLTKKCTYCTKDIEPEENVECEKCHVAKYCNDYCRKKDMRFHSKKCKS